MDGKKISASVLNSKKVSEYLKLASAVLSAVVDPERLTDKVAMVLSNPDFLSAEDQLQWLIDSVQAAIIAHIGEVAKSPLTKIQIGFDLAALTDMTVGDVVNKEVLKEAEHEQV